MRFLRIDYTGVSLMQGYGKIHAVYGDERTGSCALVGGAVRALGAGLDVGFVRFGDTDGSYAAVLEEIKGIDYVCCESSKICGGSYRNGEKRRLAERGLDYAHACLDREVDVLILDGVFSGIVSNEEIAALMDCANEREVELMMGRRRCSDEIIERADYVSEIKNIKSTHASWISGREGKVYEICGDGKGKTTMLVGEAVSYAGKGKDVRFIQFMKDGTSSEVEVLENVAGITYMCPGEHEFIYCGICPTEKQRRHAETALGYVYSALNEGADVVVCDEILTANGCMTVSTREIEDLINYAKSKKGKLIMSGHSCNPNVSRVVDCVYEVDKIKHPFPELAARKGIEY